MESSSVFLYSLVISQFNGAIAFLVNFIKNLFVASLTINANVEYYDYLYCYLKDNNYKQISATILTHSGKVYYDPFSATGRSTVKTNKLKYEIGTGLHIYVKDWYKIICIYNSGYNREVGNYSITLYFPFGNESSINKFEKEIRKYLNSNNNSISVKIMSGDSYRVDWLSLYLKKINYEDIVLPDKDKENIIIDIENFYSEENKQFYNKISKKFHRGYLFWGIPGTGKTSLISLIASHFDMKIYTFNISNLYSTTIIQKAITSIPGKSIVLFEDIDRYDLFNKEKKKTNAEKSTKDKSNPLFDIDASPNKNSFVSYNNMLQILDGIYTPEDCIIILTCNNINDIDDVFLRSGRIDYNIEFKYASKEQARKMFKLFFSDHNESEDVLNEFANKFAQSIPDNITTSQIQNHLLNYRKDIIQATNFDLYKAGKNTDLKYE